MAERKRLGVLTIKQNLFGKVYEFSVPEKEWVRLSPDERLRHTVEFLQELYPETFSKMPSLDDAEGNYVGYWRRDVAGDVDKFGRSVRTDRHKTEAALNQEKWIREHPEAFKLRNFGIKYGLGEGATLSHGGDIAALLKNAPGAISSIVGRDYEKGDYAQSVKETLDEWEIPYRLYQEIYGLESMLPELAGGLLTGGGVGVVKQALSKTPRVASQLLTRGERFRRGLKDTALSSLYGGATMQAYRHGKLGGGVLAGEPDPRKTWQRYRTAALSKEVPLGMALGAGLPWLVRGVAALPGVYEKNINPYFAALVDKITNPRNRSVTLRAKEEELALGRLVKAGQTDAAAARKRGISGIDPDTGLPLEAWQRAALEENLTITEATTAPSLITGSTGIGEVTSRLPSVQQETGWALSQFPPTAQPHIEVMARRAQGEVKRLTDELYAGAKNVDRSPSLYLESLQGELSKIYNTDWGKAYRIHTMLPGGTYKNPIPGGFRDLLKRSNRTDKKYLAKAWEETVTDINEMIASDTKVFGELPEKLSSVKAFLNNPNQRLSVVQAHLVVQKLENNLKKLTAKTAIRPAEDVIKGQVMQTWINDLNRAIDKYAPTHQTARAAFREAAVLEDALAAGRRFKEYDGPREMMAAYDALQPPKTAVNPEGTLEKMKKLFVTGAIAEARQGMSGRRLLYTPEGQEQLAKIKALLGDDYKAFEAALSKEAGMSSFSDAVTGTQLGPTAEQTAARGETYLQKFPHDIAMFNFARMFFVGRKMAEIFRTLRGLENQAIASEIQLLGMSTDVADKVKAVQRLHSYAKTVTSVKDRRILENAIRIGMLPAVAEGEEEQFSPNLRRELLQRASPF